MSRFRRVLLLTGLPIGTLVALASVTGSRLNWVDLVLTALVSASLIGAVAATVTHLCLAHMQRSAESIVGYSLSMVVIGVLVTFAVYVPMMWLPHGSWEQLPPAPEGIRELLGPACFEVSQSPELYIRGNSGRLYVSPKHLDGQAWEPVDSIAAAETGDARQCRPIQWPALSPPAPGHVVASHWVDLHGVDTGGRLRYVLLSNGTVWRWEEVGSSLADVAFTFVVLCFAAIWCFVVAMLVAMRKPPFGWARIGTATAAGVVSG